MRRQIPPARTELTCRPGPEWIDPRFVAERLQRALLINSDAVLRRVVVERVFPSKSADLGIQYGVTLATARGATARGSLYLGTGKPQGGRSELTVSDEPPVFRGIRVGAGVDGLILHSPDMDPRLPQVATSLRARDMRAKLNRASISLPWSRCGITCELLSYRPGRRCVVAYRFENGRFIVGKIHRNPGRPVNARRRVAAALREAGCAEIIVPSIVGRVPALNMTLSRGQVAVPAGAESDADQSLSNTAARVLAALHQDGGRGFSPFGVEEQLRVTQTWMNLHRWLRGESRTLEEAWKRVQGLASGLEPGAPCLLHRDFYESQFLHTARGWAVLDFDTLAAGDRELDLGNFCGHAIWRSLRAGRPVRESICHCGRFLNVYDAMRVRHCGGRSPAAVDQERLRFYLASTLVRIGVIHSSRTVSRETAPELFRIALQLMERRLPGHWDLRRESAMRAKAGAS